MSNFKTAARLKLRFQTEQGTVSVERLWDMSGQTICELLNKAQAEVDDLGGTSATYTWDDTKKENKALELATLRRDILKEILETKKSERDEQKNEAAVNAEIQELNELIKRKQNEERESKPLDELIKMRDELAKKK